MNVKEGFHIIVGWCDRDYSPHGGGCVQRILTPPEVSVAENIHTVVVDMAETIHTAAVGVVEPTYLMADWEAEAKAGRNQALNIIFKALSHQP